MKNSALVKHFTRKRKRSKENDTAQSSNDDNNHDDTVTMARKEEHTVAYERLRERRKARDEMELMLESERRQHKLNLSQITQELVEVKQDNVRWKRQLETYQEQYKRWYQELTVWIARQKLKPCTGCQQLKTFDSDPPFMNHRKPFKDLTNHYSLPVVNETATVTPSNYIKLTPRSPAMSPMRSPMWSPARSPARVSARLSVRSPVRSPSRLSARSLARLSARSPVRSPVRSSAMSSAKSSVRLPAVEQKTPQADSPTQLTRINPLQILESDSDDHSQALIDPNQTSYLPKPPTVKKTLQWTSKKKSLRLVHQNPATVQSPKANYVGKPSSTTKPKRKNLISKDPQSFVYQESVRNKAERQKMQGHACPECEAYWDTVCGDGSVYERKHFEEFSRHRAHHCAPSTPENFWVSSFTGEVKARQGQR